MAELGMYKCLRCKKPLTNELNVGKVGIEPPIGYYIESGLRAIVASGRSTYWACTNLEGGCCFSPQNKFWFRINMLNQPEPKSFTARVLGFWPKDPKNNRGG